MADALQDLCEDGQSQLVAMEYLAAEDALVRAEAIAMERDDFDTLSRLYMPLQEARRQIRQRCGEGIVKLDFVARGPTDSLDIQNIATKYSHGQLLVAGWGTIAPALQLRAIQKQHKQFAETFLAAAYPVGSGIAVVLVGLPDVALPEPDNRSIDLLISLLPPHSIVLSENELPRGEQRGDWHTFARIMELWERLHLPHLAAADIQRDPRLKIEHYRKTIDVDSACELAHQRLSETAKMILHSNAAR